MASRKIKSKDCKAKLSIRNKIVAKKFEQIADAAGFDTPTYNYFNPIENAGPRNSYFFDRDDVLDMLLPKSIKDLLTEDIREIMPTHLLVLIGAHHQRELHEPGSSKYFEKGQPTVILMGTKLKNIESDTLIDVENMPIGSMEANYNVPADINAKEDEDVGYEYPPSASLINFNKSNIFDSPLRFDVYKNSEL